MVPGHPSAFVLAACLVFACNPANRSTKADACGRFGLKQTQGCDDCPRTALTCDCGNMTSIDILPRCTIWLRCVRSVDCKAVCAKVAEDGNQPFSVINALLDCESKPACQSDAQCLGAKCYHPEPSGPGICSWAGPGSPCHTPDDCLTSHCVRVNDALMCADGQTGQPCNTSGDCFSGICVNAGLCGDNARVHIVPPPPTISCQLFGQVCQEGRDGGFCDSAKDCQSGICVTFSGGVGTCQDGSVYSPCKSDGDCRSSHCVFPAAGMNADVPLGWCSTGAVMEPCADNPDCQTGYCHTPPGAVGLCVNGEMGDPCTAAKQCKSTICVRLEPNEDGTCQSGMESATCATNDDCLNHMCIIRPPGQPAGFGRDHQCNGGGPGSFCWTGADCLSGNCAAVPAKVGGLCVAPP